LPTEDYSTDVKAIENILYQFANTFNDGDYDAWIALWADQGVQLPPGVPLRRGTATITKHTKSAFESMNFDFKITSIDEVKIFGNIGLSICHYSISASPKEGGDSMVLEPDGKALTFYEKQPNNQWKITHDCFNSNVK